MANISHSTLTDPYLHEPKGVAAATDGATYIANGAGSGAWEKIQGWEQYQDTDTTVGTPALNISSGARTQWTCDGGTLTVKYPPSDKVNDFWNTSTNKHIPIAAFDTYDFRCTFTAENYAGTDPYITMELDIGGGIGTIVSQTFPLVKGGNAQDIVFGFPVFTGTTYLANGGTVYITYTGTSTCDIYKNAIMITRTSRNG